MDDKLDTGRCATSEEEYLMTASGLSTILRPGPLVKDC